jgi:hypothetical protein
MAANSQNLFPLPYWAPALWRVPKTLQCVNEAYARGLPTHRHSKVARRRNLISVVNFLERHADAESCILLID